MGASVGHGGPWWAMGRGVVFPFPSAQCCAIAPALWGPRSSGVEHPLGKGEASGSIPLVGTTLRSSSFGWRATKPGVLEKIGHALFAAFWMLWLTMLGEKVITEAGVLGDEISFVLSFGLVSIFALSVHVAGLLKIWAKR